MSLSTPTVASLAETIRAQLESKLSISIPFLPKAFSHVLSKVLAGSFILGWKYCGFIFLQLYVAHATMDWTTVNGKRIRPLVELGRLRGVSDPAEATRAVLVVEVPVTEQTGSLALGTELLRVETGVSYRTLTKVDLDAATVSVSVRAHGDQDGTGGTGTQGNLQVGDELSFAGSPPNVASTATVTAITTTAADAEDPEDYRARVMAAWQAPPQGGAHADYRTWALEVEGIINVYPYAGDTSGEIDLYCEASLATADDTDGTPTSAQLSEVEDAIRYNASGEAKRKPINDAPNIYAIWRTPFEVMVTGLDTSQATEEEATVKSNLEAALQEYFWNLEPYIVGLSVLPRKDRAAQSEVAGIVAAVLNGVGASCASVQLQENDITIAGRSLGHGEKAKLKTDGVEYG